MGGPGGIVLRRLRVLSPVLVLVPILISAIASVLLVRRILEPTSLVVTLISSRLTPSWTKDILHDLSRLNALYCLFLSGFVSVGNRGSEDVFDHASRKAFYE